MNDPSQNELLSAYLDGELSAAEQAEVERLLAARPAARQLLDDLRALSATLQSLPQEKLGEDLSQRVVRAAQRRMAIEGKPARAETSPFAPIPLARSVFRRFVNRRTLAWLGLTAAIVVAISIYDRQQQKVRQLGDRPNQVARADRDMARKLESPPAGAAKPAAEPAEWPSIRARVEEGDVSSKVQNRPDSEEAGARAAAPPSPAAAPVAPLAKKTDAANKDEKPASRTAGGRPTAQDQTSAPNAAPFAGPNGGMGGNGAAMEPANDKTGGANHLGKEGANHGPDAAKRKGAAAGKAAKAGGAKKAAPATPPVLVVLCDVAPAAFQSRAFDKLLDANGVTGHRQPPRRGAAYGGGMSAGQRESSGAPAVNEKQATAKGGLSPMPQAEAEDAVYIEATPAQVKAVLAGLAAQPEVFLAVSAQPVEGRPAEEIVQEYRRARRGEEQFRSAVFGARQDRMDQGPSQGGAGPAKSKAPAEGQKAEQPPAAAPPPPPSLSAGAAPAAPAPSPPAGAETKPTGPPPRERAFEQRETEKSQTEMPAEEDGQQQAPRPQQAAQPAPPQRVLFVLRAAGGPPPTAPKDSAEKKHE